MGLNASSPQNKSRNKEIKAVLKDTGRKSKFSLLLLGAGESGKSTVLKQITLLHGEGFKDDIRAQMKTKIRTILVLGAQNILRNCGKFGHGLTDPTSLKSMEHLLSIEPIEMTEFKQVTHNAINQLMHDPNFKATIQLGAQGEFFLEDTWVELATRLEDPAWGGDTWAPSDHEILLARVRTTGVIRERFKIPGFDKTIFEMIDVGGQQAERRKWMALFSGVDGLIFVSSMSEYNQVLFEETSTNRLEDSLYLWKDTVNRTNFANSAVILFLNKSDLFIDKYYHKKIPIPNISKISSKKVPKVEDEEDETCQNAVHWFCHVFSGQVNDEQRRNALVIHVTCALDRNTMSPIIEGCSRHVLEWNLRNSGLITDATI